MTRAVGELVTEQRSAMAGSAGVEAAVGGKTGHGAAAGGGVMRAKTVAERADELATATVAPR